jgi:hypothetical protein
MNGNDRIEPLTPVFAQPQFIHEYMLNSAYAEDSEVLWPEMVTLFAIKSLQALDGYRPNPRTVWLAADLVAAEIPGRPSGRTEAPLQHVPWPVDQRELHRAA